MNLYKKSVRAVASLAIVGLLFSQTACTSSQITTAVDIAQISVSGLVTALSVTGTIPAPLVPVVEAYAQSATATVGQIATELGTTDTAAQKAAKIGGYLTAAFLTYQHLSPQAQTLASAANSDLQAIASLLGQVTATPSGSLVAHVGGKAVTVAKPHVSLAYGDKKRLADVLSRNEADQAKLAAMATHAELTDRNVGTWAGGLNGASCPPYTGCATVATK